MTIRIDRRLAWSAALLLSCAQGCYGASWYTTYKWNAKDFFDDPKVVELCQAIEKNDVEEMERLVAAGANVNAKGKGNMTPLLWAFPENHAERFVCLLKHGADPNVIFESDFNAARASFFKGTSVTHLASNSDFPEHFEQVFRYGGDPNLLSNTPLGHSVTPLIEVIHGRCKDKSLRVARLIKLGADLDLADDTGHTAVGVAVQHGRYDIALQLLKAGADWGRYLPKSNQQLIHSIVITGERSSTFGEKQRTDYGLLIDWLERHGVSAEDARNDVARWRAASASGKYAEVIAREVAERKAREAAQE